MEGGAKILLRHAVSALLSAAHPGTNFAYTPGQVVTMVDAALASGDRGTMLDVARTLAQADCG